MKLLALITARGGSKRLPGKNTRLLGGRPLIVWSIRATDGIAEVKDTLVSTDDSAIAHVAREAGALVPWLRPPELATDESTSVDVAIHAVDWYERERGTVDGLMLLQPTSPFRSAESVHRGCALFRAHRRPVLGVSTADTHPLRCFQIDELGMRPFLPGAGLHPGVRTLPPVHVVNGAFYLIPPQRLRAGRSFYADDAIPLVMERPEEAIDIDTEWDWKMAEAALR